MPDMTVWCEPAVQRNVERKWIGVVLLTLPSGHCQHMAVGEAGEIVGFDTAEEAFEAARNRIEMLELAVSVQRLMEGLEE